MIMTDQCGDPIYRVQILTCIIDEGIFRLDINPTAPTSPAYKGYLQFPLRLAKLNHFIITVINSLHKFYEKLVYFLFLLLIIIFPSKSMRLYLVTRFYAMLQ